MIPLRSKRLPKRLGSALVMTLVIIVLITVVTVGYLASVMLETKTAGAGLDQERAYGIAMIGAHQAMSRVREALGPWDDPYKNFAMNSPEFYWSVSPGRITRWQYSSLDHTNYGLFSESDTPDLVNLNRQLADGSYPIIGGGTNPPDVSVKWVSLLRDPSQAAAATNAIIGRYAFWVDDEGAKINVNTADGTEKYTTNSLGIGSPSEVSLQALPQGGANLDSTTAQNIVQIARTSHFSSPREILRASGVTSDVFTSNVFSLTAYSRSPELNIFGQPRVALSPLLGAAGWQVGDMVLNSLTLLPAREIYPTPKQLPPYKISSPYDPDKASRDQPWPLSLRGEMGAYSTGKGDADYRSLMTWAPQTSPNYSHNQGYLIANYLAGTNSAGQPVDWPVFPGSSTQGFAGKYTKRQLDSIVAQILSIGSKAISSDFPYTSGEVGEQIGNRFMVAPYAFPGWLSLQWVTGLGRSPKVTRMYMEIAAFPSVGVWDPAKPEEYTPPEATFDISLEWWLPAGYHGGTKVLPLENSRIVVGHRYSPGLNAIDMPRFLTEPSRPNPFAAPLPRMPDADSSAIYCFWANQLLRNNQGIDFAGNPGGDAGTPVLDQDQELAKTYHDPFARVSPASAGPWKYKGSTPSTNGLVNGYSSPFFLTYPEPNLSPAQEWQPGEMRGLRSLSGSSYRLHMQTNATALSVRGGIAVKTQLKDGHFTDPDPVPLEAVRGAFIEDGLCTQEPFVWDQSDTGMNAQWASVPAVPGDPSKGSLRDRVKASVIPVSADIPLSGVRYVLAKVEDPLVNKFPGDWNVTVGMTPTALPPQTNAAVPSVYPDTTFRGALTDPDSYWMPRADAGLSKTINDVAKQTQIPRSARMPNIGFLQYLRTGIIPDDESGPYEAQHGTPFRLLSFAPSYEPSSIDPLVGQKTTFAGSHSYPDWALLDLLYIPSTLAPFGSKYNPATANPSANSSAVTNLLYYGTYGGATAGKINPNGAVIYTTNAEVARTDVSRTLPLEAVLNGVKVNQTPGQCVLH